MWFLTSFLPDWLVTYFVHIIFVVGLVSTFAASIVAKLPVISNYGRLVQPIGMILLALGIFLEGSWWNERGWQSKVADLEKKVAIAEQKSAEANTKIETKVVTKIQVIKENVNENKKAIGLYVHDSCQLSNAAIMLHDSASQNEVSGSAIGSVRGTSEVKVPELLATVTENYGTCYETIEKLKAWQDWYKTQKKIYEEVK
jgi:hypothetical protein